MLWENIRSNEFKAAVEASNGVCAVPIGCLEKHGIHSPLGTDTIIASETVRRAAELEPVVVFPTMYFGDKSGAGEFDGTVIFSLETRWRIFRETCNEIYRNGFKKIIFCNGHGGNAGMLSTFTRAMLEENPHVMTFTCLTEVSPLKACVAIANDTETYDYLTNEDRAALLDFAEKKKVTGHACFSETALTYEYRPETVRLDLIQAECGESVHRFDAFDPYGIQTHFGWMGNYPNSYHGSNDYVLNERIAKAMADINVKKIAGIFHFLKNETISDEYQKEWLAKR